MAKVGPLKQNLRNDIRKLTEAKKKNYRNPSVIFLFVLN